MNSFGNRFRLTLFGESHGEGVGVVLDGVPAGMTLTEGDFMPDLERRRSGAHGTTSRIESDRPKILSGVFNGMTTGAPLTILFSNEDARHSDYANLATHPRPSHADWVAAQKFNNFNDYRGGGHFSGRLTLALVAAGVVAKCMLDKRSICVKSQIVEVGGVGDASKFSQVIDSAIKDGDSVGGVVECRVEGVEVGLGEPFFDSVESVVAHLMFSIPAVKGVEFGSGFGSARLRGSQNNDPIVSKDGHTSTNHSGGVNGGITNGNPIVVRVAIKPTPSISVPQQTLNTATNRVETLTIEGRHDACIAIRAAVVVEATMAIALVQF